MTDTSNQFRVRASGTKIFFETNTSSPVLCILSPDQAENLGAWLLSVSGRVSEALETIREIEK